MEQRELTIEELVTGLMNHLETIGFKKSTRERFLAYYKVFIVVVKLFCNTFG